MYGPLVLAGELGTQDLNPDHIYSDDKYLHAGFPAIAVPEFAANPSTLDQWIKPVSTPTGASTSTAGTPGSMSANTATGSPTRTPVGAKDKPLTFRTVGAGHPEDVTLSPFYRLFDQRYNIYWRFRPAADAKVSTS